MCALHVFVSGKYEDALRDTLSKELGAAERVIFYVTFSWNTNVGYSLLIKKHKLVGRKISLSYYSWAPYVPVWIHGRINRQK